MRFTYGVDSDSARKMVRRQPMRLLMKLTASASFLLRRRTAD